MAGWFEIPPERGGKSWEAILEGRESMGGLPGGL